jgi:hypothetical protein
VVNILSGESETDLSLDFYRGHACLAGVSCSWCCQRKEKPSQRVLPRHVNCTSIRCCGALLLWVGVTLQLQATVRPTLYRLVLLMVGDRVPQRGTPSKGLQRLRIYDFPFRSVHESRPDFQAIWQRYPSPGLSTAPSVDTASRTDTCWRSWPLLPSYTPSISLCLPAHHPILVNLLSPSPQPSRLYTPILRTRRHLPRIQLHCYYYYYFTHPTPVTTTI